MATSKLSDAGSAVLDDQEKLDNLSRARGWFESLKGDRFIIERDLMYRPQRAYRGFLFDVYNKYDRTITTPQPKRGEVRLPIPLVKTMVDLNTLELTKDDPTFEVVPENYDDDELQQAKWNQMLLDALYDKGRLKEKFRAVVKSGLISSVGILEVFFNPETGDGGDVEYNTIRPEDFYISMTSQDPEETAICAKVFKKNIEYIKNSKLYETTKKDWEHELKPDDMETASDTQSRILQDTFGTMSYQTQKPSTNGDVLLVECYQRYYKGTTPKYRILTFTANQGILLRYEDTDLDQPPFFVFHTDQYIGEFYGQGKVQPIIPLVKALSNIQSRLQEHLLRFVRASLLIPRGAQLLRTSNESGEHWLYNPGRIPTPMTVPAIPRETIEQMDKLERYVQDAAGIHDVSMGRAQQGIESARAIENLIQGDQQSKRGLRDNFESFIERVAKYSLKLCADHYTKARLVRVYSDEGEHKMFHAVGENAPVPHVKGLRKKSSNVAVIKPDNDVKVTVTSGMGATPESRQQKAISLNERGLLSNASTLRYFSVGSIGEEAQKALQDSIQAQQIHQQQPPPPPATIKDIVQFNADTFFTPEEKMQLKHLMFPGIKPSPVAEQDTQATQVANQMHLETLKAELQQGLKTHDAGITQDKSTHDTLLSQAQDQHKAALDLSSQTAASVNPLIPGGAIDPTQGQPGQVGILPGQDTNQGEPNGGNPDTGPTGY